MKQVASYRARDENGRMDLEKEEVKKNNKLPSE